MSPRAAVLGVHLRAQGAPPTRVGTLTRDSQGAVAFVVDEAYLRDPARPILSLRWTTPGDDAGARVRLESRADKIGLRGQLPPWFEGLLPEGALLDLVRREMGPGDHGSFDVLARLGADLPGAVVVDMESGPPAGIGPMLSDPAPQATPLLAQPQGSVKFSLAGVQLKFSVAAKGDRFTAPARAGDGRYILKVASERFARLPQVEFAAMRLAALAGVNTAPCRLIATAAVEGVPPELMAGDDHALLVERFDRPPAGGRLHMEDAAQIIGAVGDRKYTMGNTETVINMVSRFSTDHRADVLEAVRRVVVDVLVGNGDSHLKNWSFLFPAPGVVRLSPAYDIVPTVLYIPGDAPALRFAGLATFEAIDLHRFHRLAGLLKVEAAWIEKAVRATVRRALDLWPAALGELLPPEDARRLLSRLDTLTLVREAA